MASAQCIEHLLANPTTLTKTTTAVLSDQQRLPLVSEHPKEVAPHSEFQTRPAELVANPIQKTGPAQDNLVPEVANVGCQQASVRRLLKEKQARSTTRRTRRIGCCRVKKQQQPSNRDSRPMFRKS